MLRGQDYNERFDPEDDASGFKMSFSLSSPRNTQASWEMTASISSAGRQDGAAEAQAPAFHKIQGLRETEIPWLTGIQQKWDKMGQ